MADADGGSDREGPPSGDYDIPPAIACAHCGLTSCEGCAPDLEEPRTPSDEPLTLPWEQDQGTLHQRLLATSELTAVHPEAAFGTLGRGSLTDAVLFALVCETWAVASFTLIWGLGFCALFPTVAWDMMHSPAVMLMILGILLGLITFVVLVHALWGVGLEWGIRRAGGRADLNLGIRFGLYACGWDLLTSPAGVCFQWRRSGFAQGMSNVRAGTKAPRASVRAYLDDCRQVSDEQRRTAVWTAIWLGIAGVAFCGFLLFLGLLVAWLPWIF